MKHNKAAFKRIITLFMLVTLITTFLSGCNPDNDTVEPTQDPSAFTEYTPERGGTLILPMPVNAEFDTPYIVTTEEMLNLFSLVYESLISVDESGRLVPSIAESWRREEASDIVTETGLGISLNEDEDSDDDTDTDTNTVSDSAWIITLRKNIVWHSGDALTAQDVLYSFKFLRSLVTGEPMDMPEYTDIPDDTSNPDTTDTPDNTSNPDTTDTPDDTTATDDIDANFGDISIDIGMLTSSEDPAESGDPGNPVPVTQAPIEPSQAPTQSPEETPPGNSEEPEETPPEETPEATPTGDGDLTSPDITETMPQITNAPVYTEPPATTEPPPTYTPIEADASYYAYNISMIRSMTVIDDYTLRVDMNSPGISALYALTFPIVSQSNNTALVGTGPYKAESITAERVSLVINNAWWKEAPYIENVVFEARVNNETALASYEAGQLNMVPTSLLSVGQYQKAGETNVLDVLTQNVELIMFNYDNELLSDVALRKAMAYAIDTGRITANIYMNRAHVSDVPVAPDSWFYNADSKIYEYRPDTAKEILSEAGYIDTDNDGILEKNGSKLSFTLLTNSASDNTTRLNVAELIADYLLECGIEIIIETEPFYIDEPHESSEFVQKLDNREFDIALFGVNLSRDGNLSELLSPGGNLNYGGINDSELYSLAEAITYASDETLMREASFAFQTEFIERLPFVTLCFRLNSIVYSADIYGTENMREPNLLRNIANLYIHTSE